MFAAELLLLSISQASRVAICKDARLVSSRKASVPVKNHDAVTFDTTDALPLATPMLPYRSGLQRLMSGIVVLT